MTLSRFYFNDLNAFMSFQGAFYRVFLRSVGLSAKLTYIILTLRDNAVNRPVLTRMGFYSDTRNTTTALTTLIKRGYVVRSGNLYHLTGKGEMIYLQFIDFAAKHGAIGEPGEGV